MKLLVINGPNLNLLGRREPGIYGTGTYDDLCRMIETHAGRLGIEVDIRQSNHEGDLIDWIQEAPGAADGLILNPAGYTHTSVALLDALLAVQLPAVEVHISAVDEREPFRRVSYIRPACIAAICGHGFKGYLEAMDLLAEHGARS